MAEGALLCGCASLPIIHRAMARWATARVHACAASQLLSMGTARCPARACTLPARPFACPACRIKFDKEVAREKGNMAHRLQKTANDK